MILAALAGSHKNHMVHTQPIIEKQPGHMVNTQHALEPYAPEVEVGDEREAEESRQSSPDPTEGRNKTKNLYNL